MGVPFVVDQKLLLVILLFFGCAHVIRVRRRSGRRSFMGQNTAKSKRIYLF
jgi:hypothetical protein